MAQAMMAAQLAGTAMSVVGSIEEGNQARRAANFQAAQAIQQAGQERATGQRAALEARREANLADSRAQAIAAAGGGGGDVGTINLRAAIRSEGDYNALRAMYQGEDKAVGLETAASAKKYEGQQAKRASVIRAVGQGLSGMGGNPSLMQKYAPAGYSAGYK